MERRPRLCGPDLSQRPRRVPAHEWLGIGARASAGTASGEPQFPSATATFLMNPAL